MESFHNAICQSSAPIVLQIFWSGMNKGISKEELFQLNYNDCQLNTYD